MPLYVFALCFACAVLGAVVGVLLLFRLSKPRALLTVDIVFKRVPTCDACGKELGTKHFLEAKASDTFPITIAR